MAQPSATRVDPVAKMIAKGRSTSQTPPASLNLAPTVNGLIEIICEQLAHQKLAREKTELTKMALLQSMQIFSTVRGQQLQAKKKAESTSPSQQKILHELAQTIAQFVISLCSQVEDVERLLFEIIDDMSSKESKRSDDATQQLNMNKTELMAQFHKIVLSSQPLRTILGTQVCQRLQNIFQKR